MAVIPPQDCDPVRKLELCRTGRGNSDGSLSTNINKIELWLPRHYLIMIKITAKHRCADRAAALSIEGIICTL